MVGEITYFCGKIYNKTMNKMKNRHFFNVMAAVLFMVVTVVPAAAQYDSSGSRAVLERYNRTNTYGDVVEVMLKEPGTLEEQMPQNMMNRVRLLHIEGPLDKKDLKYLKKLCNRSKCVDRDDRKIDNYVDLELEHARIVNSGNSSSDRDVLHDDLSDAEHLRLILLPEQLKRIDSGALKGCKNLEEVIMPKTVQSIGNSAFKDCSHLEYVSLGDGLKSIGKECFKGCKKLESVKVPQSVTEIGAEAFAGSGLKLVALSKALQTLGAKAFDGTALRTLEIPAHTKIANNDLGRMKYLKEITVERKSKYYSSQDGVLYDNTGRELLYCPEALSGSLTVPEGVNRIGRHAFDGSALSTVVLPATITVIGEYAFANSALTAISAPAGVSTIESHAFYDCSKMTTVELHRAVETIGESAFENCTSLKSISLPEAMTEIKPKCFKKCTALEFVAFPPSLSDIGKEAFEKCSKLTSINLPHSLATISERAFKDCTGLTRVTIPDACTWVKKEAFLRCSSLIKIDLGKGLKTLGENALRETAITTLVIPASVTRIGKKVVEKCRNLSRIECHAVKPPTLEKASYESVGLYVPASSVNAYKSAKNWKKIKHIYPL